MSKTVSVSFVLLLLLAGLPWGCRDHVEEGAAEAPARETAGDDLPPGHPPLDTSDSLRLAWQVPQDWITEPAASAMRVAQYRVPGPAGEARCVVFYFGAGEGGDPEANARRWATQFEQPDGGSSLERMSVTFLDSAEVPVRIVEITGTYDGGMAMGDRPALPQPGFMLLGGIAEAPQAPWFFKLTGPEETVRAQRAAFVQMMESIRLED